MPGYVALPGSKRTLPPHSRQTGQIDKTEVASITIRVRSAGNPDKLVKKVYELARLPLGKRQYLTRAELGAQHGAKQQDLDKIEHYALQHNLTVVYRNAAERSVVLRGRLDDLLAAFPADLQKYDHVSGRYRGRSAKIWVPQELKGIVTGVFGLDTGPKQRVHRRAKLGTYTVRSGNNGVAATKFAKRYNFPEEWKTTKLDGAGQTIAIIELGGSFRSSDLKVFFKEIGRPMPHVTAIAVGHAGNDRTTPWLSTMWTSSRTANHSKRLRSPDGSGDSADIEVMLDIEVAGTVAPKANIAVYFASDNSDKGFLDAISAAIHDTQRKPSVISISWGAPEALLDEQGLKAYHELFAAAGALGITVCAAAGDHGVAGFDATQWDNKIHVDHPACDDLVLSCGGTQIKDGVDVVWNDDTPFDEAAPGGGGWAGGGGISQVFAVPAYQKSIKLPPALQGGKDGRGVPDIAMSATNYFTQVDSHEHRSRGTSAVVPLMSGLVALLNQARAKPVGFLNPFLYSHAANIVMDVKKGNNGIADTVEGYKAGDGWDACSGLGTPDGAKILAKL